MERHIEEGFLCVFPLCLSTACSSRWVVVSVEYFLTRFRKSVEEDFRMLTSRTPARCLFRGIPQGILFFLALFQQIFQWPVFFYLDEATR